MGKKKVSPKDHKLVAKIVELRDSLLETAKSDEEKEMIHAPCKGMYKCSKLQDEACLTGILDKLKDVKKSIKGGSCGCTDGGGKRRKSKTRARSRSKTRARSRSR